MAKYINADLLKAEFTGNFQDAYTTAQIKAIIEVAPAADVAEAVRCKDCKFSVEPCELVKKNGIPGVLKCSNKDGICNNRLVAPNDFCNYAKRLEATP